VVPDRQFLGFFTKKSPNTADVKKRRIKYKIVDNEKRKNEIHEAFVRVNPNTGKGFLFNWFCVGASSNPKQRNIDKSESSRPVSYAISQNDKGASNLKQTQKGANTFLETFSTTVSNSKHKTCTNGPYYLSRGGDEPIVGKNKSQGPVDAKLVRQPSMPIPLKSTDIVRNIQTVKRSKRANPAISGKGFNKIKSCEDIHATPPEHDDASGGKTTYRWERVSPFLSNPIEALRQERLRKERLRHQKLQKEREKLQIIDRDDISIISLHEEIDLTNTNKASARGEPASKLAEIDYTNIKLKICNGIGYIPNCPVLREDIKETLQFIDILADF
jgi:hypothetical protein